MTATPSTRRGFVATLVRGAALPIIAGCASAVGVRVTPAGGRVRLRIADHPALTQRSGAVRLIVDGLDAPVFVLATGEGEHVALSARCTHRGCTVNAQGDRLVCPCHGSTYDRQGAVRAGPAERPLRRFPVRELAEGIIEIEVEDSA